MSDPPFDAETFREFEKSAHDRVARSRYQGFAAVSDQAVEPLLDAARIGPGTRLLDVAAGAGRIAAAAARRGARAIGTDLSPAMVVMARERHPDVTFQEADAEHLPFADASFDAVVCAFGVGHFPSAERVVAEFMRVLSLGGYTALSWWQDFTRNRLNGLFHQTVQQLGVKAPGVVPAGPPMDRYTDPTKFIGLLRSAGFADVQAQEISFKYRLRNADELWALAMGSFARVSSVILAQSEDTQTRIRAAVSRAAQDYAQDGGLEIPVAFRVVAGRRA